jgi:hypothetical protein
VQTSHVNAQGLHVESPESKYCWNEQVDRVSEIRVKKTTKERKKREVFVAMWT